MELEDPLDVIESFYVIHWTMIGVVFFRMTQYVLLSYSHKIVCLLLWEFIKVNIYLLHLLHFYLLHSGSAISAYCFRCVQLFVVHDGTLPRTPCFQD